MEYIIRVLAPDHKDSMSLLPFAKVDAQIVKDKQLRREDLAKIEEWQRMQPHLPAPLHPIETALFLHSCYYSHEKAKKRIDLYYTYRSFSPELFGKCDPLGPEIQHAMDTCLTTILPNLTPDGYMVCYGRLLIPNADMYSLNGVLKLFFMMSDLALRQRGCHNGYIGLLDLEGFTLAHILKCNILSVKKLLVYLQTAMPVRVKSVHFVNGASILDKVMAIIRPFLKQKLLNRIYTHSGDNSTILNFIPDDMWPIECGGSKFCATEYFENVTRKSIESNSEFFMLLQEQVVNESRRLGIQPKADDIFGVEGTFKKLDID